MILRTFRKIGSFIRLRTAALLASKSGMLRFGNSLVVERLVRIAITDGGSATFGDGVVLRALSEIVVKRGTLNVGKNSFIGRGATVVCRHSINIGTGCLLAEFVTIRDQDHVIEVGSPAGNHGFTSSPVLIGDNVWLGAKVTVTQGVTIGNNVVVGANSVVTHDLPDNCVAVGAPARVVRQLKVD